MKAHDKTSNTLKTTHFDIFFLISVRDISLLCKQ